MESFSSKIFSKPKVSKWAPLKREVATKSHMITCPHSKYKHNETTELETEILLCTTKVPSSKSFSFSKSFSHTNPNATTKRINIYPYSILDSDVGLIISERIINMPPQIAVPLYQTLANEVKKAKTKNLPFNFTHYAIISKILMAPEAAQAGIMYTNAEEEVFVPECEFILDTKNTDEESRIVTLSQDDFIEKKKVMVFRADKLDKIVNIVKNAFPIS